jgi:PKD repeat protein
VGLRVHLRISTKIDTRGLVASTIDHFNSSEESNMKTAPSRVLRRSIFLLISLLVATLIAWIRAPASYTIQETWTPTGSLNTSRFEHTATLLEDGKVLVAGGASDGTSLTSAELYDPTAGTWSVTSSMTAARESHTATLLPDGSVLVAGGESGTDILASAELYDPATETWSATGNLNTGRYDHTATLLPNGTVLVVAGAGAGGPLASAELYDPATDVWTTTGSLSRARGYHNTATLLANGQVLVAAGSNTAGGDMIAEAELYDPATGTWSGTGSLNTARFAHTATRLSNGKVLVAGGNNPGALASAELYDPATGVWSSTGHLNTARRWHSATLLQDGQVLVAAGYGDSCLVSAELYDPGTGTWSDTASLGTAHGYHHTATLLPNSQVLVAAGGCDGTYYAGAELYGSPTDGAIGGLSASNDSPTPLGQPTTLWATVSAGSNVTYTWDFGDGFGATGATVSHTYPDIGVYTAVVTATNSLSEVTTTTTVTVDQRIDGLVATSDSPTALGNTTTLTAVVSAGSHVSYTWSLGDGHDAVGDVVHHAYADASVYIAMVTAANSVSTESANTFVTVDAPIDGLAVISDAPTVFGMATMLTATVESGTSISWVWSLGDGSEATGAVVSHVYPAPGTYPVDVTATNWLNSVTARTDVQILNSVYLPAVARRWPPVPYTPQLNAIDNPDQDGRYTVTWQEADRADAYVLEEATGISFSDARVVYQGPERSWSVPDPGNTLGTYYYRVKARSSWGDSAWSNVQSTIVTHGDLIVNGGFESGPPAAPWVQYSSAGLEMIDGLGARTGDWGVYMGGLTSVVEEIYQTVTIPARAESPQLSYWRLIRTADSADTVYDEMRCVIWDANGEVLAFCGQFSNVDESRDWIHETYDMSKFKGQTVDVGFKAFNDDLYDTQFFIDDVSLTVSSSRSSEAESLSTVAEPETKWLATEYGHTSRTGAGRQRIETQRPFRAR